MLLRVDGWIGLAVPSALAPALAALRLRLRRAMQALVLAPFVRRLGGKGHALSEAELSAHTDAVATACDMLSIEVLGEVATSASLTGKRKMLVPPAARAAGRRKGGTGRGSGAHGTRGGSRESGSRRSAGSGSARAATRSSRGSTGSRAAYRSEHPLPASAAAPSPAPAPAPAASGGSGRSAGASGSKSTRGSRGASTGSGRSAAARGAPSASTGSRAAYRSEHPLPPPVPAATPAGAGPSGGASLVSGARKGHAQHQDSWDSGAVPSGSSARAPTAGAITVAGLPAAKPLAKKRKKPLLTPSMLKRGGSATATAGRPKA